MRIYRYGSGNFLDNSEIPSLPLLGIMESEKRYFPINMKTPEIKDCEITVKVLYQFDSFYKEDEENDYSMFPGADTTQEIVMNKYREKKSLLDSKNHHYKDFIREKLLNVISQKDENTDTLWKQPIVFKKNDLLENEKNDDDFAKYFKATNMDMFHKFEGNFKSRYERDMADESKDKWKNFVKHKNLKIETKNLESNPNPKVKFDTSEKLVV